MHYELVLNQNINQVLLNFLSMPNYQVIVSKSQSQHLTLCLINKPIQRFLIGLITYQPFIYIPILEEFISVWPSSSIYLPQESCVAPMRNVPKETNLPTYLDFLLSFSTHIWKTFMNIFLRFCTCFCIVHIIWLYLCALSYLSKFSFFGALNCVLISGD